MQFGEYARLLAAHARGARGARGRVAGALRGAPRPLALPTRPPASGVPHQPRPPRSVLTLGPRAHRAAPGAGAAGGVHALHHPAGGGARHPPPHRRPGRPRRRASPRRAGLSRTPGPLVGDCADVLPLRSRAAGATGMVAFLKEVRGWLLDAFEHEVFAYARLPGEAAARPRAPAGLRSSPSPSTWSRWQRPWRATGRGTGGGGGRPGAGAGGLGDPLRQVRPGHRHPGAGRRDRARLPLQHRPLRPRHRGADAGAAGARAGAGRVPAGDGARGAGPAGRGRAPPGGGGVEPHGGGVPGRCVPARALRGARAARAGAPRPSWRAAR